jgi:hypothetical protein
MISAELAQITNCFLGDAVLADRVSGDSFSRDRAPHWPYLFYQPVNYRARDDDARTARTWAAWRLSPL